MFHCWRTSLFLVLSLPGKSQRPSCENFYRAGSFSRTASGGTPPENIPEDILNVTTRLSIMFPEDIFQRIRRGLVRRAYRVRINIPRRGDTGMPQPARHGFQRNSPGDKQGRVRMPQAVYTNVRQSLAHNKLMEPL